MLTLFLEINHSDELALTIGLLGICLKLSLRIAAFGLESWGTVRESAPLYSGTAFRRPYTNESCREERYTHLLC